MPPRLPGKTASQRLLPLTVVIASTALLLHLAATLLPSNAQSVGEDYSYFYPYLVAGANWIRLHGWFAPPTFTVDFCGGLPWIGNPQSVVYSVPQLLASFTDLASAVRWTFIAFATIGAAAMFALLRRVFETSLEAAALGFVLFQLNGFLLFRMASGHLTFHVFGLAPLIALLLLCPATTTRARLGLIATAATSLALIIYAGGIALIPPITLGVAGLIVLAQFGTGLQPEPWRRFVMAALWSVPLSAIKLVPALLLMLRFPRHELSALMPSAGASFARLLTSLFWPGQLPAFTTLPAGPVTLGQNEFEFGISIVPLLLLLIALGQWIRHRRAPRHRGPFALLIGIGVCVTLLSTGSPSWSRVLHGIPIIAANSVGSRWWIVWMLLLIVGAALAFDRVSARRTILLAVCALLLLLQSGVRSLTRYTTDTTFAVYDPAAAEQALVRVKNGAPLPRIDAIARPVAIRRSDGSIPWTANDGVFRGESAVPCYDPLFGHDFRSFPATTLVAGLVLPDRGGAINLADPRCYMGDGGCAPGTRFSRSDSTDVSHFTNHQGLHWDEPAWQRVSRWSTAGSLLLTIVALVSWATAAVRARQARVDAPAGQSRRPDRRS